MGPDINSAEDAGIIYKIFVTTPNTFVLASRRRISWPSLTNSVWLINSNTTFARSPVRIKPEGWSSDNIRTVCYGSAYTSTARHSTHPDRPAVHHCLVLWLNRARMMQNHDHALETFDGWLSEPNQGVLKNGDSPLGGVSVLPTRTIPFLT